MKADALFLIKDSSGFVNFGSLQVSFQPICKLLTLLV
jgi:hypothetical protein